MRLLSNQAGYSTWETIGLVPFYVLVVLIIVQVALGPLTQFRAEVAAWSAARASVRGNDPVQAARDIAGGLVKDVVVHSPIGCKQKVTVRLTIPAILPFMQGVLPLVGADFTLPRGDVSC